MVEVLGEREDGSLFLEDREWPSGTFLSPSLKRKSRRETIFKNNNLVGEHVVGSDGMDSTRGWGKCYEPGC